MYLGVDLGTSGVKIVLTNASGEIVDTSSSSFEVSRPKPLWSEQNPQDWWTGFCQAMDKLSANHDLSKVLGLGLSGQMHGATLLDDANTVIRPAILWNDGRCEAQCKEIEAEVADARELTGNIIMAGFTAPKLLWVKQHEPANFARIAKVLLPKDYLRFLLTGDYATDMSDAAGTMWLDVKQRTWHTGLLAACGLDESHMPRLFEGSDITGTLKSEVAARWNMSAIPVIAGGGDNAAGAVGVGIVKPGQAMLSLGTSGVYFAVTDGFTANPESAVHSFCHALPNTWHLMSVVLSAASCLQWFADNIAKRPVQTLLDELDNTDINLEHCPIFLPYLSGERTPHNNPFASGSFFGLNHSTAQVNLTYSVLEGVSFAFADGVEALNKAAGEADEITLIGGGAKSRYWRQLLADVLARPVNYRTGGDVGPGLGAARLAQIAIDTDRTLQEICPQPALESIFEPNNERVALLKIRREQFQQIYVQLAPLMKQH
ncbi:MAG: xylulokinase [Paraglaciecola sp.]|uniref:xylulokinase n=1 Tax=Pseudomonadati TaxID=3379134 RepID=UPI00273D1AF2|nr:xylulokinase [Paraglaciecola sp.]MDP5032894.1 xylulokinase [Paraglaciecola sp.]MDP5132806.1 xylulokinase [Paraglaciecola sp.]